MDEKFWKHQETDKVRYYRRYDELKKQGKSFYPYSIFKDAIVSGLIFIMLLLLVVVEGVPLEAQADPTNTAYIPRPEWYFMFLFEMLKYFPGELEWVGVVVIPSLVVILLLILPFIDRRPVRLPSRRPLALVATGLALVAILVLTYRAYESTPVMAAAGPTRKLTAVEQAGKKLYQSNCAGCHGANGVGGQAAPPLVDIGSRRDPDYIRQYIENPKVLNPGATMPGFLPPLSHDEVEQITRYLLALKNNRG